MYPDYMRESVKKLEKTRQKRIQQKIPFLSLEERQKLLEQFHPDYKPGTKRALKIGPNKGEIVPNEVADLIEAYSKVDLNAIDLSKVDYETDVLVIGGGGAGVAAAILAHDNGANVLIATKLRLGDGNTTMAQGGIQAADRPEDSPAIHYLDAMGGGGFVNIPELVKALVMDAPMIIKWLEDSGYMFDKYDDGLMIEAHGGGTSKRRMHSAGDYSGLEVMRVLKDEVLNREIPCIEFSPAVELLTDDKVCTGAVLLDLETREYKIVRAKCVILATGGAGRLHVQGFPTTNHYGATMDGVVIAYRAGAPFIFMDTIQYHPTGAVFPEQIRGWLCTEKLRGFGAQVVNADGERFINEGETRDAESAGIIRECIERKKGIKTPAGAVGVWLDTPLIDILKGPGTIQKYFPAMFRLFKQFEIDITKEPILIYPTQHYQNGGTKINDKGETQVLGLLAAGEVEGGVHGRNRLMGNSLLDILVFGRRAGIKAAELAKELKPGKLTLEHVKKYHKDLEEAGIPKERKSPMLLPDYRPKEIKHKTVAVTF